MISSDPLLPVNQSSSQADYQSSSQQVVTRQQLQIGQSENENQMEMSRKDD